INRLASQIRLGLLVVQPDTIDFFDRQLAAPANIWVKIDVGTRRTGILPTDEATLETVFAKIERAPRLRFRGFLAHAGHTYAARSKAEIQKIHEETTTILKDLKARYRARFPDLEISTGDTPSCSVAEGWEDVDEMRPGNFVFYDLMQVQIGACRPEDIAVALAAPVVAKHADRQEIVVYGGGIHLSKDRLTTAGGQACFGWPVRLNANGWERPDGESFVKSLSQEHGVVKCAPAFFERVRVGDVIGILPVHSCMMVDLFARYVDVHGGRIEKFVFGK
ncbi:MAG: alanine racemase, partial [Bacteroidetes bacterium]